MINDRTEPIASHVPPGLHPTVAERSEIIHERRRAPSYFAGWGPRLMVVAVAVAAATGAMTTATPAMESGPSTCASADREAALVAAPTPEWPDIASVEPMSGAVRLAVDLSETATLTNVVVATSSGYAPLDREAMRVARHATFAPAVTACTRQPGTYAFVVDFVR